MARSAAPSKPRIITRRRRAASKTVKKTFTLAEETVRLLGAAVREGRAENLSAYVEAAIEEKLRRATRDVLYDSYQAAAQDPAFMADMRGVAKTFKRTAADGLRDE